MPYNACLVIALSVINTSVVYYVIFAPHFIERHHERWRDIWFCADNL